MNTTIKDGDTYVYLFENKPYINLTNRCPNACAFCIRNNADGVKGNRLWLKKEPTAEQVLLQLQNRTSCYDGIVFCGYGEPVCALDALLKVAEVVKKSGKHVRLNTNGLGNLIHGRDIVPELAKCVDEVSISLNAASKEAYAQLCKPKFGLIAYSALWDFAQKCVQAGIETALTAVDSIGASDVARCRELADKAGIPLRVRHYITDNENYQ